MTISKLIQASLMARSQVPLLVLRRRTVAGVGAYFGGLTGPDFERTYGRDVHVGLFWPGTRTLAEALDNMTGLVTGLAGIRDGSVVVDLGCGLGKPAMRAASSCDCQVIGVNVSRAQVLRGRQLVQDAGYAARVKIKHGNALATGLPAGLADCVMLLESAGDICVTPAARDQLARETWRLLKPGGTAGFCDLAFRRRPSREDDRAVRRVLYHTASELAVDWPGLFRRHGFTVSHEEDLHEDTLRTWDVVLGNCRSEDAARKQGKLIAAVALRRVEAMVEVVRREGMYPAFRATRPADAR